MKSFITTFLIYLIFVPVSCKNRDNDKILSLDVYYPMGSLESYLPLNCNDITRMNMSLKVDTLITERKVLSAIGKQIKKLDKLPQDSLQSICDIRIVCNVKYENGNAVKLCIGSDNCILKNDIRMVGNNTLIYLIRKCSGYYCYFTKGDLVYFDEIKQFGVPSNYKDLSLKTDSSGIPTPPPIPK